MSEATKDPQFGLDQLPSQLLHMVLERLDPHALCRLAACSHMFKLATNSHSLWHQHSGSSTSGSQQPTANRAAYSAWRNTLCKECQCPTRYVHTLLGCRLCTQCEHACKRYALVTALEARDHLGLSELHLESLASVLSCGCQFFLQEQVLAAVARATTPKPPKAGQFEACLSSEPDPSSSDDDEQGPGSQQQEEGGMPGNMSDVEDAANQGGTGGTAVAAAAAAAAARRAEDRAQRKAAKKETKAQQRARRQDKASGTGKGQVLDGSQPRSLANSLGGSSGQSPGSQGRHFDKKKARHRAVVAQGQNARHRVSELHI
ncbi:hypothetical protein V8C86DRAFT_2593906 [Haematococcus lacustris]